MRAECRNARAAPHQGGVGWSGANADVDSVACGRGGTASFTDHLPLKPDLELSPIPGLAGKPLFSAVEYVERAGSYVAHVQFYESNGYLLVRERDGRVTSLRSRPDFSPDGQRVAAVGSWGDGAGSELQIWRIDQADAEPEFSLQVGEPPPYESIRSFEPVGWDGNFALRFIEVTYSGERGRIRTTRRLVRVEEEWGIRALR